jgi:DNA helicase-2/ATP-dependent DNA helicase PcrA
MKKLDAFRSMIQDYRSRLPKMEAFDLAFSIAESSGIMKDLHVEDSPENLSKYENLQELLNGIKEYVESQDEAETTTLDAYLQSVSLLTDADNEKEGDRDRVSIMTIHSAKGLEFKYVYVTGLEEELFPSRMSSSTREELEEERRLFYVALTRAMKKVTLSFAGSRYRWGVPVNGVPSRFIREIDTEFMEQLPEAVGFSNGNGFEGTTARRSFAGRKFSGSPGISSRKSDPPGEGKRAGADPPPGKTRVDRARPAMPKGDFKADDPALIQSGMQVEHPRFGRGKVLKLEGPEGNRKATVFFQDHGQKQLLLKFARLKINQ